MTDDHLWKHIRLLAAYLGADVTSSDHYCAGTRCYDWQTGKSTDCPPGQYEQILSEFLLHDPAGVSKAGLDVLVLVGGIGTGKSTTVREMMRQVARERRTCSATPNRDGRCTSPPIILDFDTGELYGEPGRRGVDKEKVRTQLAEFWNVAASRLERVIGAAFTFDRELSFWNWALDNPGVRDRSSILHRWLNDCDQQIRALSTQTPYLGWSLEAIAQHLQRQRSDLMNRIPERDLVWYRVFQLIYAIRELKLYTCSCRYIFLDNVDQLEPEVQRTIVDFVILLSDVLRARTLIAIRPLTWERSVHAHMLVRTENHHSPIIKEVLLARVRQLAKDKTCPADVPPYLRNLVSALTSAHGLWSDMFDATSGLSLRFAIRNFLNFSQSQLLPPLVDHANPLEKMKASEVARAFFFGDSESMLHNNLENLYGLGNDMRNEYRLLKPRLLDYIVRVCDGVTTRDDLNATMLRFGYTPKMIIKAANDMLLRSRPLLWSQDGHHLSSTASRAKISATPIGRGYYEKLFGQVYYDEVCMARGSRDVIPLEKVIEFHQQLWEQDKVEISRAVRKHGVGFYQSLYPEDKPAISAIHAANLWVGVERRDVDPPVVFGPDRVKFIAAEVERLLGPKW